MKVLTEEMQERLKEIAGAMIGSYIEAVEKEDISDFDSWMYWPDHWEYNMQRGEEILAMLGMSPEEIDMEINSIREDIDSDRNDISKELEPEDENS